MIKFMNFAQIQSVYNCCKYFVETSFDCVKDTTVSGEIVYKFQEVKTWESGPQ